MPVVIHPEMTKYNMKTSTMDPTFCKDKNNLD